MAFAAWLQVMGRRPRAAGRLRLRSQPDRTSVLPPYGLSHFRVHAASLTFISKRSDSLVTQRFFRVDSVWLPRAFAVPMAVVASLVIGEVLYVAFSQPWVQASAESSSAAVAPPPIGTLAWPMPGAVVTQGFGPSPYRIEPPFGGYAHFHTGLDLQGPPGSLVLAADGGLVTLVTLSTGSGPKAGYGSYVVIDHGRGLTTLYAHLAGAYVRKGQVVRRGQVIGSQGNTGNSTGPHLHFEVRVNGIPIDPARCFPTVRSSRPAADRRV